MANDHNDPNDFVIEADFGTEPVAPAQAGGLQPPEGLFEFAITKRELKQKAGGHPQIHVELVVVTDPAGVGGLGKTNHEYQTVPNAKQESDARKTTVRFFKKFLVAFGVDPKTAASLIGAKKLPLGKRLAIGAKAWAFYFPFVAKGEGQPELESETIWLDADEKAKVVAGTLKLTRKPSQGGKGGKPGYAGKAGNAGKGGNAADDLAADPLADDLGEPTGATGGNGVADVNVAGNGSDEDELANLV